MLVIKVHVNYREIDEILIHNQGIVADGIYQYRVYHSSIPEEGRGEIIRHKRDEGYIPLLLKAMEILERYRINA